MLFAVSGVVLAADLLTKWIAAAHLEGRPSIELIPGALQLTYTTNTGGAFGLSSGTPWLFGLASITIIAFIASAAFRVDSAIRAIALGSILGGALGNLIGRLSGGIDFSGRVIDFVDLKVWPVFNLADSAIVVGAVVLAISYGRKVEDERAS